MAELKLKLNERWVDDKTGVVIQSIITDETIHIDDDLDFEIMTQYYIGERTGSSTHDGVRHEVTIWKDELTKEQMFDFILNNNVTLHRDGTMWTKYNEDGTETKIMIDYNVSINGSGMNGFGLVEAINYYVKEIQKK
jgi:hypothetical protein